MLSFDARLIGGLLPKSSFTLYTFADTADPLMAVAETVNTDLVHTDSDETARYTGRYSRLWRASLPPSDNITFLDKIAN